MPIEKTPHPVFGKRGLKRGFGSCPGLFLTPLSVPRKQCERSRTQTDRGCVEAKG